MAFNRFQWHIALAFLGMVLSPVAASAQTQFPVNDALADIRGGTVVPIYLPEVYPASDPLYVSGLTSPDGYYLTLDYTPDCGGATACNMGNLTAEQDGYRYTESDLEAGDRLQTVPLANGVTGQFVNLCGAYCSAILQWDMEGVLYTVYMKNGSMEDVVEIANSAIQAGPRQ